MKIVLTDNGGSSYSWELKSGKSLDKLIEALKENMPDWQTIIITIENKEQQ